MNSGDIKQVREMLASLPDTSSMSVEDLRAVFDRLGRQLPLPGGVSAEKADAGGVCSEWLRAQGARADAVILYLHGGGYVVGSPASYGHLVAALSQVTGASALSLDYRLAPEHPFPAAVDDAGKTFRYRRTPLLDSRVEEPYKCAARDPNHFGPEPVRRTQAPRPAGKKLSRTGRSQSS